MRPASKRPYASGLRHSAKPDVVLVDGWGVIHPTLATPSGTIGRLAPLKVGGCSATQQQITLDRHVPRRRTAQRLRGKSRYAIGGRFAAAGPPPIEQIGRASCRGRVVHHRYTSVVRGSL